MRVFVSAGTGGRAEVVDSGPAGPEAPQFEPSQPPNDAGGRPRPSFVGYAASAAVTQIHDHVLGVQRMVVKEASEIRARRRPQSGRLTPPLIAPGEGARA